MTTRWCTACGNQASLAETFCRNCGTRLREDTVGPLTLAPESSGDNRTPATARYVDAYRVARATIAVGRAIKMAGVVLGLLVFLAIATTSNSDSGFGPLPNALRLLGVVSGVLAGGWIWLVLWILGVIVTAQGEILQATLDGAVHTSPFLTLREKAGSMGLPDPDRWAGP